MPIDRKMMIYSLTFFCYLSLLIKCLMTIEVKRNDVHFVLIELED